MPASSPISRAGTFRLSAATSNRSTANRKSSTSAAGNLLWSAHTDRLTSCWVSPNTSK
jgi:hypothetical protein